MKESYMNDIYVLVGKETFRCESLSAWGAWMETADRKVGRTTVGKYEVSTFFLGIDHSWDDTPPKLFETMIFFGGDGEDEINFYQTRCSTWEQAEKMHEDAVRWLKGKLGM
jgi:hypothetical protein